MLCTEHGVHEEALQDKLHVKQARRGGAGIALPILDPDAKMEWVVSTTPRPLYSREREQAPIAQEAGWTSELVLMEPENIAPTGFRTSDRPTSSESLHRLRHTGRWTLYKVWVIRLGLTSH